MSLFTKKRRIKSERGTSSGSWRKLVFSQLCELDELNILLQGGFIYLYRLITTLDTEKNCNSMLSFIASSDIKSLLDMEGKFPFDADEADYPSLNLLLLKTLSNQYLIIYRENEDFTSRKLKHVIVNNFINKDEFDTRMLIYPI